ncbi:MAG TPA: hypothetical protein VHA82_03690 [Ramlibacter sp.]|uniref:hypothetical protein n=1 Tax=Ramlibacter sp. TaxID=1917967 RepID=UPI002B5313BC|nr:hypothetical protein [Ramlibacter sp.]HVZ42891.1 hypothetical protein [Ramlibacter sp.]
MWSLNRADAARRFDDSGEPRPAAGEGVGGSKDPRILSLEKRPADGATANLKSSPLSLSQPSPGWWERKSLTNAVKRLDGRQAELQVEIGKAYADLRTDSKTDRKSAPTDIENQRPTCRERLGQLAQEVTQNETGASTYLERLNKEPMSKGELEKRILACESNCQSIQNNHIRDRPLREAMEAHSLLLEPNLAILRGLQRRWTTAFPGQAMPQLNADRPIAASASPDQPMPRQNAEHAIASVVPGSRGQGSSDKEYL